jgi:hypothetical protein
MKASPERKTSMKKLVECFREVFKYTLNDKVLLRAPAQDARDPAHWERAYRVTDGKLARTLIGIVALNQKNKTSCGEKQADAKTPGEKERIVSAYEAKAREIESFLDETLRWPGRAALENVRENTDASQRFTAWDICRGSPRIILNKGKVYVSMPHEDAYTMFEGVSEAIKSWQKPAGLKEVDLKTFHPEARCLWGHADRIYDPYTLHCYAHLYDTPENRPQPPVPG